MAGITWTDLLYPGCATQYFEAQQRPNFAVDDCAFNTGIAWWLAELSRLVYRQDSEEISAPLEPRRGACLTQVEWEQIEFFHDCDHGTQAFLVQPCSRTCAALVFRGTDQNIRDFLCDVEIGSVLGEGSSVHAGFKRGLDCVWPNIERALNALTVPVFYAGHSLGGALAILAAARRAPTSVYAYGAPRVGNKAFVRQLKHVPIFRVVHGDDIVATVPPEIIGFEHVGEEVRIGAAARVSTTTSFDLRALWNEMLAPPKALADHAPINYVLHLAMHLAAQKPMSSSAADT